MTFDKITEDGRLWAVRYDGASDNILSVLFDRWNYIITGGAIKLTTTMQERQHTLIELQKMENVRNFLINENIIDNESFIDYMSELE